MIVSFIVFCFLLLHVPEFCLCVFLFYCMLFCYISSMLLQFMLLISSIFCCSSCPFFCKLLVCLFMHVFLSISYIGVRVFTFLSCRLCSFRFYFHLIAIMFVSFISFLLMTFLHCYYHVVSFRFVSCNSFYCIWLSCLCFLLSWLYDMFVLIVSSLVLSLLSVYCIRFSDILLYAYFLPVCFMCVLLC